MEKKGEKRCSKKYTEWLVHPTAFHLSIYLFIIVLSSLFLFSDLNLRKTENKMILSLFVVIIWHFSSHFIWTITN